MEMVQNCSVIQETPASRTIAIDDMVNSWFLMDSIWPITMILSAYLLFVLKIGPEIMEKRKPLEIKKAMLVYNVFQVIQNARIIWLFFSPAGVLPYAATHLCYPLGMVPNNPYAHPLCDGAWWFLVSKIVDLLDTVFFVLRKKQSHVTFLHVYHHTNMVVCCWIFLKYMKDEQLSLVGVLNSWMHVLMYSYYFLAAMGPAARKYLWWKKYITRMQIIQFLMGITFLSTLLWHRCDIQISSVLFILINIIIFLTLFLQFYSKTYKKEKGVLPTFMNGKIQQVANGNINTQKRFEAGGMV